MFHLMHSASLVSAAAVGALISAIWQGTVLAATVVVCMRLMPRLSAAARSAIWLNVFALMVLLHILPALSSRWTNSSSTHISPIHLDLRWCIPIAVLWSALSVWKGAQLVFSAVRLGRIASRATRISACEALQALHGDQDGDRSGRSAELCISEEVARPCVFGFLRPRVLVPLELMEQLSGEELRLVVQHEMEHLRRVDDWTNLLQKIVLALFPLNPVLYWVERRLCRERELACDDRALKASASRKAYAICLTRLAEHAMVYRGLSLVLGAWERQSELASRVYRILSRPAESMSGKPALIASSALVVGALGCAAMLSRSPQLVSFAPLPQPALQPLALMPRADIQMDLREMGAPQLVKAVMPQRRMHAPNRVRPARSRTFEQVVMPQPIPTHEAWVVLTEWSSTEAPPRIVIAVQRDTRPSYAAVQFGNGWLIVQI